MLEDFVHLNVHSEYSVVDGIVRIDELVSVARENNMKAVALTDQANLFAMVKFFKAAIKVGIKPIFGSEIWLENDDESFPPYKMIFLCQNQKGYLNLSQILSIAYLKNHHNSKAIVKKEWIQQYNEDLILISNPRYSDVSSLIYQDKTKEALTKVKFWKNLFKDRFYLGLSRIGRVGENNSIEKILKIAFDEDLPVVALNEVCFLKQIDFEAHEARVCINEATTLNNPNRIKNYKKTQYFKSSKEMIDLFSDIPEAILNSVEIAKRCNYMLELGKVCLPNFPLPDNMNVEQYFIKRSKEGLEERLKILFKTDDLKSINDKTAPYYERLNTELEVLNKMGFAGYFLIVADFISWAKENKIPVGPGRGSGAGSLVAYSLLITNLDPLEYELLFERFLNPERVSMPDFDIDFCMEGRDKVIEYVANKYGHDAVSQIITYGTMAARAVIRDVGRVLGHPYVFVDKIAKLIPMEIGINLEKALMQEEALNERYKNEEEVKFLIDLAKKLEGITRNVGKHAGGVVIAPSKITDFSPTYCIEGETSLVSQFDKNDIEEIGLVKFDFLGLRTLTIINWAVNDINKRRKEKNEKILDINFIPLDDKKTYDLLKTGQTTAIFQIESRGMKDLVKRLQPDIFDDIMALVALYRPGPLQSGMVDDFIDRKLGNAAISYPHHSLKPILKPTYGVILYQEQVMQIAQTLAGYTLGAADILRKAMGKKKPEEMAKQRDIFTKGAIKRNIDEKIATYIFDLMEKFAGYGFNKSHSAAYALISYQTAWLKAYYPAQFMAAVLSSDMNNTDKIVLLIEDAKHFKLNILPPDINTSLYKFSVDENDRILYGLGAIKGVGEAALNNILETRKNRDFVDIFDFSRRVDLRKVTKRVIEALIKAGAFDSITRHRACLFANIEAANKASVKHQTDLEIGQIDLFSNEDNFSEIKLGFDEKDILMWSDNERLKGEKETLGLYLTGHPLTEFEPELTKLNCVKFKNLVAENNVKKLMAGLIVNIRTILTKRGDRMAIITIDDRTARQDITVFSDLYLQKKELIKKDAMLVIQGEVGIDDFTGGFRVRAFDLMTLDEARIIFARYYKLLLRINDEANINLKINSEENIGLRGNDETNINQSDSKKNCSDSNKNNNDGNVVKKDSNFENLISDLKNLVTPYVCEENGLPVKCVYQLDELTVNLNFGQKWRVKPSLELLESINSSFSKFSNTEITAEICF